MDLDFTLVLKKQKKTRLISSHQIDLVHKGFIVKQRGFALFSVKNDCFFGELGKSTIKQGELFVFLLFWLSSAHFGHSFAHILEKKIWILSIQNVIFPVLDKSMQS